MLAFIHRPLIAEFAQGGIMKIAKGIALLLIGISAAITSQAGENKKSLVTISLENYKAQMKEIQKLGIDVAGINYPKKQVDLIVIQPNLPY